MKANKKLLIMEAIGALFTIVFSIILHFVYDWSGNSPIWGILGAANESVWEHVKIIFLPFLLWSIVEFLVLKPDFCNFIVAKTTSLFFIMFITISFFYVYTGIIGEEFLIVDILSAFSWAILAHVISYKMLKNDTDYSKYCTLAILGFIIMIIMYFTFTLYPPNINLFLDSTTGTYGLK